MRDVTRERSMSFETVFGILIGMSVVFVAWICWEAWIQVKADRGLSESYDEQQRRDQWK